MRELLEILDRRFGGESGVGPAQILTHVRVAHREAFDVRLVDDRVGERDPRRSVALPLERVVDYHRLRYGRRVVLVVGLEVGVLLAVGNVGQDVGVVLPVDGSLDRLGVRIDQELRRIEAVAPRRGRTGRGPESRSAGRVRPPAGSNAS